MMYITIFKTSVPDRESLVWIGPTLDSAFGKGNWSFAFEDTDKILRVVSRAPCTETALRLLSAYGFLGEELPYSLDEFKV
ncbi:hypothetical protein [Pedobacter sp.]|uniref:hypothetical protein n=1 Tax=Pedobacter sp. TaxID=1411316 RepID=UPI002C161F05|nr:hypothetical protein [Pedobacter sp.]HWW38192.1 hypothetical protein [Pedobacter sp.]